MFITTFANLALERMALGEKNILRVHFASLKLKLNKSEVIS